MKYCCRHERHGELQWHCGQVYIGKIFHSEGELQGENQASLVEWGCGLENTELTSRYLSLRCLAASRCACVWVWNSAEIFHKDLVLGWPKRSLGFFIRMLLKKPKRPFWPTQYHFLALPAFKAASHLVLQQHLVQNRHLKTICWVKKVGKRVHVLIMCLIRDSGYAKLQKRSELKEHYYIIMCLLN